MEINQLSNRGALRPWTRWEVGGSGYASTSMYLCWSRGSADASWVWKS